RRVCRMARDYELGIIINPDAGDERARAIVERVTQVVSGQDGQVVRVDAWGRRHLAYPIERHRDGLFFWLDLILPPQSVAEVERTLRVNEDVMRHLITLRDPRVVTQKRQREAELAAQAEAHAVAQANAAAAAAQAAEAAGTAAETSETPEAAAPEAEASDAAPEAEASEAPAAEAEAEAAPQAEAEAEADQAGQSEAEAEA
ncbi:MAG TPA: 30S ribosomal protein S6, partial [Ktedonobacterales bacterium]|nr:30S ribosomal protein S6 [Ktedonobacterales bacterium]